MTQRANARSDEVDIYRNAETSDSEESGVVASPLENEGRSLGTRRNVVTETRFVEDSNGDNAYAEASDTSQRRENLTREREESTLPPPHDAGNVLLSSDLQTAERDELSSQLASTQISGSSDRPVSRSSVRSAHTPALRPFERRFHARSVSSALLASRSVTSPVATALSRQSSVSSQFVAALTDEDSENQKPWEVVKWSKLKGISAQAFSEAGRRAFGTRTQMSIGASIAIGTSKGITLLFDYQQSLKSIVGQATKATECGAVTSLATSADHSTIASGHSNGSIFTWDVSKPAQPILHISPLALSRLSNRNSDGHVTDYAVIHIGFLGARSNALVSADSSGMAFSHLATRRVGPVGKTIKSTRILGRYPSTQSVATDISKPSSVLALAALPLGNVPQLTDDSGLTALLTPHLLVVVSTLPIAQTQYKAPRSQKITAHGAMTGSLAWFPAVRLKSKSETTTESRSCAKLVYCWSNLLTVLDVEAEPSESAEDKRPNISFQPRSQWKCSEAIISVQWLSRSVLTLLTITQKLLVLEDHTMRVADYSDLIAKHIYHQDLFSRQLQPLVDKAEQDDPTLHGVIPDAYSMSFKAYKGRLFLLGMNEIAMGTLSNWADRIVALMEGGSLVDAIELATSYFNGTSDKITVGLPDEDASRHEKVRERLLQIIIASLRYVFKANEVDELEGNIRISLQELTEPIFKACIAMSEDHFLLNEVYEWFSDASCQDLFLEALEPRIIDDETKKIPPNMLQDLILWYTSHQMQDRLEAMICCLDIEAMDIDQICNTCKAHNLYDAYIYVWTQAFEDYVTPLDQLMRLSQIEQTPDMTHGEDSASPVINDIPASKMFPYMAYSFTGRIYPKGTTMPLDVALKAKTSLYDFLFSSNEVTWSTQQEQSISLASFCDSSNYPYLRAILRFDTASFMSMLNEAFEDSYLNQEQDPLANGDAETKNTSSAPITRSRIIAIMLEAMSSPEFGPLEKTYLNIFIARNLPKFPQFILLPIGVLHSVLTELCDYPTNAFEAEAQLSVEYLLSYYHPVDIQSLVPRFQQAGFYRVLKLVYKSSRQYARWLQTFFDDPEDKHLVFSSLVQCLRPSSKLSTRQLKDVKDLVVRHAVDLAVIDAHEFAVIIWEFAKDTISAAIDRLDERSDLQYTTLQNLLEPSDGMTLFPSSLEDFARKYTKTYVQLMCKHEPQRVSDYINTVPSANLRLEEALPMMEQSGVVDAAVLLMARDGLVQDAMKRLTQHLGTLRTALVGLLESSVPIEEDFTSHENVKDVLSAMQKYTTVGIWLCSGALLEDTRMPSVHPTKSSRSIHITEGDLTINELLWLDLIDSVVASARAVPLADERTANAVSSAIKDATVIARNITQETFTALLAASSSVATSAKQPAAPPPAVLQRQKPDAVTSRPPSFLSILRCFLTRASAQSPTLNDLRAILGSIFSAYAFEESILQLSSDLIDKDVFAQIKEAENLRRTGWRPRSMACERCKRRAWGPGTGVPHWDAWGKRHAVKQNRHTRRGRDGAMKGKGRATSETFSDRGVTQEDGIGPSEEEAPPQALILFACYHIWHCSCLRDALQEDLVRNQKHSEEGGAMQQRQSFHCPLCTDSDANLS